MGSRQRGRVVQTYGRRKQRVVTVDPWSSGESKHHLFSSFSSEDSSLHNLSGAFSNTRQGSRNCRRKQTGIATYNISDTSSSSSSSSNRSANSSNGSLNLFAAKDSSTSQRVLRDKTNLTRKTTQVTKKQETQSLKKTAPRKKSRIPKPKQLQRTQKQKENEQSNTGNTSTTSSRASLDGVPNFSDLDKYSLLVSDSPLVETGQPNLATSLVQTSTPHVSRLSGARAQNVGKDLSLGIAAGSPIPTPADDDVSVNCVSINVPSNDQLHVSNVSSIACEMSKDFSSLNIGDSFIAELPAGVSIRKRSQNPPIMKLMTSHNTKTSDFDPSLSLFDESARQELPTTTIREKLEALKRGQSQRRILEGNHLSALGETIEISSDISEYLTAHQDQEDDGEAAGSCSESESGETEETESDEQLSDIEEGEELEEEQEEEAEIDEEDEEDEDEEEDSCAECSKDMSSRKSSLDSEHSEAGNVTRYMLAENSDQLDDSSRAPSASPGSELSHSVESDEDESHTEHSTPQMNSLQESFSSVHLNGSTSLHRTPVMPRNGQIVVNSGKGCFSPMLLLTPIRLHKTGRLATDREKVLFQCDQDEPLSFTDCLTPRMVKSCVKIGEGTFGEVYKATKNSKSVALKVIPIEGSQLVNDEVQKTFNGILTEIVISKQLSALRDDPDNATESFVGVNDVSLVQGAYPDTLLKQWDLFKNSENDRPDYFDNNQLFIVFEFEECGCAVESFKFKSVKEAISVLHQVTCALAVAEAALKFEHRDLHVGNVLVKHTSEQSIHYMLGGQEYSLETHGVKVAIIDFTLSRLTQENVSVHTNLGEDEELFQGHGDYQFDVYRLMREENGDDWAKFTPATNVLWIHYLAQKLSSIKFPQTNQKLSRQFRNFQREVLDYYSALNLLRDCPFFNER